MSEFPAVPASGPSIRLVYLARLREAFGRADEELVLPAGTHTVGALIALLRSRGGVWAAELEPGRAWRVAVNHALAKLESSVADGDEVAFLPPVTGG